jgi:hypothetical protein
MSTAPIPREHGAWGLLLQPFLAGAILTRQWDWLLLPALGLVLFGFLLREPLTVLARQQFVWRDRNPQTAVAARWLAVEAAGALACLLALAAFRPLPWLLTLSILAIALTALAVTLTIRNLQRSILLQIVSAAGLGTTALLAIFAVTGRVPLWGWQLWAILTLHGAVSILAVHTRLKQKTAARKGTPPPISGLVFFAPAAQVLAAALLPVAMLPLLFSAGVHSWELCRLRDPETLQEPLVRVGFRALGVSILHSALAIAALWPYAA